LTSSIESYVFRQSDCPSSERCKWVVECRKFKVHEEEVVMLAPEITEVLGLKQCHVCYAELLDRDKFCRHCGISQSSCIDFSSAVTGKTDISDYETKLMSGSGTLRRSYSGPLVNIMTQELSEGTSSLRANRWARRLVSALVAVPLWLMIVLLSPFDAYTAAKAIARQV
jgi:hypothetical protein